MKLKRHRWQEIGITGKKVFARQWFCFTVLAIMIADLLLPTGVFADDTSVAESTNSTTITNMESDTTSTNTTGTVSNAPTLEDVKTWGGTSIEQIYDMIPAADGDGYMAVATSASDDYDLSGLNPQFKGLLLKVDVDENGKITNVSIFAKFTENIELYSIALSADNNYVVAGESHDSETVGGLPIGTYGFYDAIIAKVSSSDGSIVWAAHAGGSKADGFNKVQLTSDGGFIAVGFSNSTTNDMADAVGKSKLRKKNRTDTIVAKYKADGTREWFNNFGSKESHENYDVLESNGGYLIGGVETVDGATTPDQSDFQLSSQGGYALNPYPNDIFTNLYRNVDLEEGYIAYMDSNGNLQWIRLNYGRGVKKIEKTKDGGFIVASEQYITKYNSNWDKEWETPVFGSTTQAINTGNNDGGQYWDWIAFNDVKEDADGNYLAVGDSYANTSIDASIPTQYLNAFYDFSNMNHGVDRDTYIVKLNSDGQVLYVKDLGGSNLDGSASIQLSSTGGFYVTGNTMSSDGDFSNCYGSFDAYIVKLSKDIDADGDGVPNDRDYYPYDSSKSIPDSGINLATTAVKTYGSDNTDLPYSTSISYSKLENVILPGLAQNQQNKLAATDNVSMDMIKAKVNIPVAYLDSLIGTDHNNNVTFTSAAVTDKTRITSLLDTSRYIIDSAYDLSLTKSSTALQLPGSVQVTLSTASAASSDRLALYSYDGSTMTKVSGAVYDTDNKTVTFHTNKLGTYVVTEDMKPETVSGVTASAATYNSVNLNWSATGNATGYEIYRSATVDGDYSKISDISAVKYTDSNLITDSTYYYKVRAYNTVSGAACYGDYSEAVSSKVSMDISNSYTKTDAATGITVTAEPGIIPKEVDFSVAELAESAQEYKSAASLLGSDLINYKMYGIGLKLGSAEYTMVEGKEAAITVPVPSGYNSSLINVYQIKNGKVVQVTSTVANGKITFQTSTFGTYVIAEETTVSSKDSTTGISMAAESGVLPANIRIVAKQYTSLDTTLNKISALLENSYAGMTAYDISLYQDSSLYTLGLGQSVTVSIPIPEGYDTSRLAVYHIINNMTGKIAVDYTIKNGYAVLTASSLSPYVIVEQKAADTGTQQPETTSPKEPEISSPAENTSTGITDATMGTEQGSTVTAVSDTQLQESIETQTETMVESEIPSTGDQAPIGQMVILAILAAFVILGGFTMKYTEKHKEKK